MSADQPVLLGLSCPRAMEHDVMDALRKLLQPGEYAEVLHLERAGPDVALATPLEQVLARARGSQLQLRLTAARAAALLEALKGQLNAPVAYSVQALQDHGVLR